MASGARIGSAIIFVRDLDRSVGFYQEVFGLEVTDRTSTAALLTSAGGAQLALRAMGGGAARALGTVGVQYVIWTASNRADLDRAERALKARSAHRDTRSDGDVALIEGQDPDDVPVMIVYPGPDRVPLHKLPVRVYAW
jgi:catechol 2,3-dioxygenase-like lactoylglutathione lyase family enzyme